MTAEAQELTRQLAGLQLDAGFKPDVAAAARVMAGWAKLPKYRKWEQLAPPGHEDEAAAAHQKFVREVLAASGDGLLLARSPEKSCRLV